MPNPLLPRLTTTNQVTTFGNAGRWEKRESAELERISEGLDVGDTKIAFLLRWIAFRVCGHVPCFLKWHFMIPGTRCMSAF